MTINVHTMWWLRNSLLIIFCCFLAVTHGQLINVADSKFKDYLCTSVPEVMTTDCAQLDVAKANNYAAKTTLGFIGRGISNMDEVRFFSNVDRLEAAKNNLTEAPNLSGMNKLEWLNLTENNFEIAPELVYIDPSNTSVTNTIKFIYIERCNVKELPATWYGDNAATQSVHIEDNDITEIPDFSKYTELRKLYVMNNQLDFEDLLPIIKASRYSRSNYFLFPQQPFEMTFPPIARVGEEVSINVSSNLSSNSYKLFKDAVLLQENRSGEFIFSITGLENEGVYHVEIYNDNFTESGELLTSKKYPLTITDEAVKRNDLVIFSPNGDGLADFLPVTGKGKAIFYTNDGIEVRAEQLPFNWRGDNESGTQLEAGIYLIRKNEDSYIKVLLVR